MSKMKSILFVLIVLLIAGLSYSTYHYYSQYKKAESLVSNPQEISKMEISDIVSKVSLLMELPAEEPTMATVLDAEKLKDQPFFANTVNGDKVLIYAAAKKAILYRPSTNKIIDMSPLYPENAEGVKPEEISDAPKATPTPTPTAEATPAEEEE